MLCVETTAKSAADGRGAQSDPQRAAALRTHADNRAEARTQRELQEMLTQSPRMAAQRQHLRSIFGEAVKLQAASAAPAQREAQLPTPLKRTGLPDGLRTGIESLSGIAMDHVQVHFNSSQPAQLSALAFAKGSDIHVAPGQEQHLPHEAWHVVQRTRRARSDHRPDQRRGGQRTTTRRWNWKPMSWGARRARGRGARRSADPWRGQAVGRGAVGGAGPAHPGRVHHRAERENPDKPQSGCRFVEAIIHTAQLTDPGIEAMVYNLVCSENLSNPAGLLSLLEQIVAATRGKTREVAHRDGSGFVFELYYATKKAMTGRYSAARYHRPRRWRHRPHQQDHRCGHHSSLEVHHGRRRESGQDQAVGSHEPVRRIPRRVPAGR